MYIAVCICTYNPLRKLSTPMVRAIGRLALGDIRASSGEGRLAVGGKGGAGGM